MIPRWQLICLPQGLHPCFSAPRPRPRAPPARPHRRTPPRCGPTFPRLWVPGCCLQAASSHDKTCTASNRVRDVFGTAWCAHFFLQLLHCSFPPPPHTLFFHFTAMSSRPFFRQFFFFACKLLFVLLFHIVDKHLYKLSKSRNCVNNIVSVFISYPRFFYGLTM